MTTRVRVSLWVLCLWVFLQLGQLGHAQTAGDSDRWVATWSSAQQEPRGRAGVPASFTDFQNRTIRMTVHTSIAGTRIRVQLSNAFGTEPLTIGAAHVAIQGEESEILPESDRTLLFGGMPSITIPPGAPVVSDPVDLGVPALSDLAISVFITSQSGPPTTHSLALRTTYISRPGDFTAARVIEDPTTSQSWYWLSGVDVLSSSDAATVVALGDSITDGAGSSPNSDQSWPSLLAERLAADPATRNIAIINQGISGNRVLSDAAGVSALARFDRDVLSQSGVRWLMLLEGINDIGGIARGTNPITVSSETLIAGMRQIVDRAHTHGIQVIGCTLTPFEGAGYFSEVGEAIREAVNDFIRTSGVFDAVVDFDVAVRDPENARQIRGDYHVGDFLHPNDRGYQAMADAVDLSIFGQSSEASSQRP